MEVRFESWETLCNSAVHSYVVCDVRLYCEGINFNESLFIIFDASSAFTFAALCADESAITSDGPLIASKRPLEEFISLLTEQFKAPNALLPAAKSFLKGLQRYQNVLSNHLNVTSKSPQSHFNVISTFVSLIASSTESIRAPEASRLKGRDAIW